MVLSLDFAEEVKGKECKGLIFRGYNKQFVSGNHIGLHQGLKLLKRKSCPGCEECSWVMEQIADMLKFNQVIWPEIEDGKLYSVHTTNEKRDLETGLVDDYDFEIFEVNP